MHCLYSSSTTHIPSPPHGGPPPIPPIEKRQRLASRKESKQLQSLKNYSYEELCKESYKDLQHICKLKNLTCSGKKEELISRILQSNTENDAMKKELKDLKEDHNQLKAEMERLKKQLAMQNQPQQPQAQISSNYYTQPPLEQPLPIQRTASAPTSPPEIFLPKFSYTQPAPTPLQLPRQRNLSNQIYRADNSPSPARSSGPRTADSFDSGLEQQHSIQNFQPNQFSIQENPVVIQAPHRQPQQHFFVPNGYQPPRYAFKPPDLSQYYSTQNQATVAPPFYPQNQSYPIQQVQFQPINNGLLQPYEERKVSEEIRGDLVNWNSAGANI